MTARERLRQWMSRSRLTARETARLLGITEAAFSMFMGDPRRCPRLAHAARLEDLTGIPMRAWLERPTANPGPFLTPSRAPATVAE